MAIVRRPEKVTPEYVRSLKTTHLFAFFSRGYDRFEALVTLLVPGWMGAAPVIAGEGEPNVIMHSYEAEPGAWLFDDSDSGIGFLVLSDGLRENSWKGSSIEVLLNGRSPDVVPGAFERLVKRLVKSSNYYGFCRQDEVRAFIEGDLLASASAGEVAQR